MSQEFDNNVLDLLKQKTLYPYENMNDFGKLTEEFSSEEKIYSSLTGKKIIVSNYEHIFNV